MSGVDLDKGKRLLLSKPSNDRVLPRNISKHPFLTTTTSCRSAFFATFAKLSVIRAEKDKNRACVRALALCIRSARRLHSACAGLGLENANQCNQSDKMGGPGRSRKRASTSGIHYKDFAPEAKENAIERKKIRLVEKSRAKQGSGLALLPRPSPEEAQARRQRLLQTRRARQHLR